MTRGTCRVTRCNRRIILKILAKIFIFKASLFAIETSAIMGSCLRPRADTESQSLISSVYLATGLSSGNNGLSNGFFIYQSDCSICFGSFAKPK